MSFQEGSKVLLKKRFSTRHPPEWVEGAYELRDCFGEMDYPGIRFYDRHLNEQWIPIFPGDELMLKAEARVMEFAL